MTVLSGPQYSVVMPAFNAEATIGEAIRSILRQSSRPAEILVVDDGSTDGTAACAQGVAALVRVIRQENAGSGSATTRGMTESRGDIIATLDADDIWMPEKMQRQLAHLAAQSDVDGVFSHQELFGKASLEGRVREGWVRSTLAVRRRVFERIGAVIDPPGGRGEMVDWITRARQAGFRFEMLPEILVRRRVRTDSASWGRDRTKDLGYLHAVRESILRKRQGRPSPP